MDPGFNNEPDKEHTGKANERHVTESNVWDLLLAKGMTSVSIYAHTTRRSEIKTSHLACIQTSHQLTT